MRYGKSIKAYQGRNQVKGPSAYTIEVMCFELFLA